MRRGLGLRWKLFLKKRARLSRNLNLAHFVKAPGVGSRHVNEVVFFKRGKGREVEI
jgi:hypothetical protein